MKRLTSKNPLTETEALNLSLTDLYMRLKLYEDTGLEPEEIAYFLGTTMSVKEAKAQYAEHKKRYDEYMSWKQAESEVRLLILPCKVQGRLYAVELDKIREVTVNQFYYDGFSVIVNYHYNHFGHVEGTGIFGRTVFLTREEAEAALRGGADI